MNRGGQVTPRTQRSSFSNTMLRASTNESQLARPSAVMLGCFGSQADAVKLQYASRVQLQISVSPVGIWGENSPEILCHYWHGNQWDSVEGLIYLSCCEHS